MLVHVACCIFIVLENWFLIYTSWKHGWELLGDMKSVKILGDELEGNGMNYSSYQLEKPSLNVCLDLIQNVGILKWYLNTLEMKV